MTHTSFATCRSTFGTRRRRLIDGWRFSSSWIGISSTRKPPRQARTTNSEAKTSRSTTQARTTGSSRSRRNAFSPWVSVPWKPRSRRRSPLWTRVASRRMKRAPVARAARRLAPHHHVQRRVGEETERAVVEAQVTEVDLVAEHQLAPRLEHPLLQRRPVVGGGAVEPAEPGTRRGQPIQQRGRAVDGAVLGEQHLVVEPARVQARGELRQRRGEDPLLVVDRDDHGQPWGRAHWRSTCSAAARPPSSASSIEEYSQLP